MSKPGPSFQKHLDTIVTFGSTDKGKGKNKGLEMMLD
jgi:hypothetical protein